MIEIVIIRLQHLRHNPCDKAIAYHKEENGFGVFFQIGRMQIQRHDKHKRKRCYRVECNGVKTKESVEKIVDVSATVNKGRVNRN